MEKRVGRKAVQMFVNTGFCAKIEASRDSVISTFPTLTKSPVSEVIMAKESLPNFSFNSNNDSYQLAFFWSRVAIKTDPDACWEWQGRCARFGYGRMQFRGKTVAAHRIAWAISVGRMPRTGMVICHSCDNPPCCNPRHLREDTQQGNMQEMVAKGRMGQKPVFAGSPTARQFCKHGHPWTPERLRMQKQYTGTITYVCKDCHRDQTKQKRHLRTLGKRAGVEVPLTERVQLSKIDGSDAAACE